MDYEAAQDWIEARMKEMRSTNARSYEERRPLFVTLSRQAGAGGIAVATALTELLAAERVGSSHAEWAVLDRDLLEELIRERVLHEQYMSHVETRVVRGLDEQITRLHRLHRPSGSSVARTNRTILHLAAMGNVLIVGRGANVVTRDMPGGLRVRLVGAGSRRLAAIQDRHGSSRDAARSFMEGEDEGRAGYVLRNFNRDVDDPLEYDLLINTDGLVPATTARLILEALRVKQGLVRSVPDLAPAS